MKIGAVAKEVNSLFYASVSASASAGDYARGYAGDYASVSASAQLL